jgi:hypothetical protein
LSEFNYIDLDDGEQIIFGPRTITKYSGDTMLSGRGEGITNWRVAIENIKTPEKTYTIPNDEIQRVHVKYKKKKEKNSISVPDGTLPEDVAVRIDALREGAFKITRVDTVSGTSEKLGLEGTDAARLHELFPNAQIIEHKGSKIPLIIGLVALIGGFLLCALPIMIVIIGEIVGGG